MIPCNLTIIVCTLQRHASSSDDRSDYSEDSDYSTNEKRKYREYSPQYTASVSTYESTESIAPSTLPL